MLHLIEPINFFSPFIFRDLRLLHRDVRNLGCLLARDVRTTIRVRAAALHLVYAV